MYTSVVSPQCELGSGSSNDIFTEMIVTLGAILGSLVDLLIFPKIIMKNIANMHRKHNV